MVVTPLGADQPVTARLVEATGAGIALADPDASSLRAGLERALRDADMREAAGGIAREIAAMPSMGAAVQELERFLRNALVERSFGSVSVHDLKISLGEDSEAQTALYADVVLADPAGDTWPIEDVQALRREIRDILSHDPPPVPWYVLLRPKNEQLADEELDEEASS